MAQLQLSPALQSRIKMIYSPRYDTSLSLCPTAQHIPHLLY